MTTAETIRCIGMTFSGPMVGAILSGRKTMTRRIAKDYTDDGTRVVREQNKCPYSEGDRIWAKETFDWVSGTQNGEPFDVTVYQADGQRPPSGKWTSSRFMPRRLSRLALEITDVRVERLADTSAKDILAEGVVGRPHKVEGLSGVCPVSAIDKAVYPDLKSVWFAAWNSIHGKNAHLTNPFVWVISFRRVESRP